MGCSGIRPLRILNLLGEPFERGGQESYIISNYLNMNLEGLVLDVLTPYWVGNQSYKQLIEEKGGTVFELGLPFNPGHSRKSILEPLTEFFSEHDYDIVHIHSGSISVFRYGSQAAKKCGAPFVIAHSHSSVETMNMKKRIIRRISAIFMNKNIDLFCACSAEAGKSKFLPGPSKKIVILKNGIAVERFRFSAEARKEIRDSLGATESTFVIGNVGRLAEEKNHEFIIKVFDEVCGSDENCALWVVGDGPLKEHLLQETGRLESHESIHFLGARDDIPQLLSGMDVFLFPSIWEGLGISLIEAQASGLPCVVSNNVAEEADIAKSFIKRLSLAEAEHSWADAVESFKGERNRLGAQEVKVAGYDIEDTARRLRELYFEIAAE